MRGIQSFELRVAGALALVFGATPALADYPGSTQPGAQQVLPGNLVLLRAVPPRNAIIAGAGRAVTAPTAPPSAAFGGMQGVGFPLSDTEAASVIGSIPAGQGGQIVAETLSGALRSQSMVGGAGADRSGASRGGVDIGGAVGAGVGALHDALGGLGH